jgi:hypothetical protein
VSYVISACIFKITRSIVSPWCFFLLDRPTLNEGPLQVLNGPLGLGVWKCVKAELETLLRGGVPGQPQLWVRIEDLDETDE